MIVYGVLRAGAVALAIAVGATLWSDGLAAEPFMVGPEECEECHENEYEVWENTPHAESYRELRRNRDARGILRAVGDRRPQRSDTCTICHYTMAKEDPGGEPEAVAGPSCESCHGAASEWIDIHNDYGGKDVKREDESPEHRRERIEQAKAAGMVWPHMKYDAARNCFQCHGMNNDALDAKTLNAMLEADHPINGGFEFVKYSQGAVKHRFYPPKTDVNQDMQPALKSEWFVVGQAASLVAATQGLEKSDNERYRKAMKERIDFARKVLGKVPAASDLLADPSAAKARKLAKKLEGKDLTDAVGDLMPAESDYVE